MLTVNILNFIVTIFSNNYYYLEFLFNRNVFLESFQVTLGFSLNHSRSGLDHLH